MSVYLSVCLSLSLSVCLSVCLCLCLRIGLILTICVTSVVFYNIIMQKKLYTIFTIKSTYHAQYLMHSPNRATKYTLGKREKRHVLRLVPAIICHLNNATCCAWYRLSATSTSHSTLPVSLSVSIASAEESPYIGLKHVFASTVHWPRLTDGCGRPTPHQRQTLSRAYARVPYTRQVRILQVTKLGHFTRRTNAPVTQRTKCEWQQFLTVCMHKN